MQATLGPGSVLRVALRPPLIRAPDEFLGDELDASARAHLEPPELERLFAALQPDPFWCPYFAIQYFYGCRVSEVALIFENEVSLSKKRIIIKRLKKGQRAKRADWIEKRFPVGIAPNTYVLPAHLAADVERVLAWKKAAPGRVPQNPFLFPSNRAATERGVDDRLAFLRTAAGKDGRPYQAVSRSTAHRRFVEACDKAEIPANLSHSHVLRHTRATLLYASEATAAQVQHLLGHSSEKITATYLHAAKTLRDRYDEELLERGLEGFR